MTKLLLWCQQVALARAKQVRVMYFRGVMAAVRAVACDHTCFSISAVDVLLRMAVVHASAIWPLGL